ncbi:hypothetical protein AAVH_28238 [Aphelenchoides avenae]|nr:hypothetical protein AAVH_28238 [Aphelenchus avenae]
MRLLLVVGLSLLVGASCVASADLRSYRDETYAVKAVLGTPGQQLYLSVDAFGSGVVVSGVDCWQCCDKAQYDASLSTTKDKGTCKALPDAPDGTKIDACSDVLQSPVTAAATVPFTEVVSSPSNGLFVSLPSDGVWGLSSSKFGYYFARTCSNDAAKGGTITVGAFDTANCDATKPLTTLNLNQDPTTKILSAQLDKYQVGTVAGTEVPSPTGAAAQWRATFTNASPNVTIPQDQFNALSAKFGKVEADNTFECKNSPASTPIKFTFAPPAAAPGTAAPAPPSLSFDIQQLVFQTDDGKCALRLNAQKEKEKQNIWEFGLPLFRTYCSLVDINDPTKATVQFLPPKVRNDACTYNKAAPLQACSGPQSTSTAETTISPNATQPPSQTTTPKGASRGQVMSLLSVFMLFALPALF